MVYIPFNSNIFQLQFPKKSPKEFVASFDIKQPQPPTPDLNSMKKLYLEKQPAKNLLRISGINSMIFEPQDSLVMDISGSTSAPSSPVSAVNTNNNADASKEYVPDYII